jgi:tRNA(Ile)-lysidine synthase
MLNRFIKNLVDYQLINKNERLLLTVSGGIDSVAMTYLFQSFDFDFAIAHCNFQLRGQESEDDQIFVSQLARNFNKVLHNKKFDTESYAREHNISIQMAARDLRYKWFHELAEEFKYDKIATAHNRDDVVETFLLNLTRGTGIRGLTGIKHLNGKIIRPMLYASRPEIVQYVKDHNITFREDSSNIEVKYKRNLLRHNIIPLFNSLNPSFTDTIIQESEIFRSVNGLYQSKLEEIKQEIIHKTDNKTIISISGFLDLELDVPVLFDIIRDFGFNYSDVKDIFHSIHGQSGKKFYSENYILIRDRDSFIIELKDSEISDNTFTILNENCIIVFPIKLKFEILQNVKGFQIPKLQKIIALDYDTLRFPLTLRHWQKGDYFHPLGTKGRKKLSDYFVDKKIPVTDKNKIWILTSEDDIVWIVGYQIDDKNKVNDHTNNILLVSLND